MVEMTCSERDQIPLGEFPEVDVSFHEGLDRWYRKRKRRRQQREQWEEDMEREGEEDENQNP